MQVLKQTTIPSMVRVKPGALERVGLYAGRHDFNSIVLLYSEDLSPALLDRMNTSLASENIQVVQTLAINFASFEKATEIFKELPAHAKAIIGFGGGKALDVAKYVAFLARRPYLAVATSLSNDGICSPQSSLTVENRRRSLPSTMPFGVVIDTEICRQAPKNLWLSGVGDLVAKFTAVTDWKLAFHHHEEPVDDFAVLLSDASVYQFMARPECDLEGMRLLGTSLLLNGIAMSICGSSRAASGSEHLISHALDSLSKKPRLHGLQVGVATYIVSILQEGQTQRIADLFDATGFWRAIAEEPFSRKEWIEAVRAAPAIKDNFYTILSTRDCVPEVEKLLASEPHLQKCFVD